MADYDNTVLFIHTAEIIVKEEPPQNQVYGLEVLTGGKKVIVNTNTGEIITKLKLTPNKHAYKELCSSGEFHEEVKKMLTEAGYNLDKLSWQYNRLDFSLNFLNAGAYEEHLKLHGLLMSLLYSYNYKWEDFYETYHKYTHVHQNIKLSDKIKPHWREYEYYNKTQQQAKLGRETEYIARFELRECELCKRKTFDSLVNVILDIVEKLSQTEPELENTEKGLVKYLVKDYEKNGNCTPFDYADKKFSELYTREMAIQFFIDAAGVDRKRAGNKADYLKRKNGGKLWLKQKDITSYIEFINGELMRYCTDNFKLIYNAN